MKEKFGRTCKELMVKEISERLKESPDFIVASFEKVSAEDFNSLRRSLASINSRLLIAKNSLFKRALNESKGRELAGLIDGESGIVFGSGDPVALSKALAEFKSDFGTLSIKGGIIEGEFIEKNKIEGLAKIPPKEILLAKIVAGIRSPLSGLASSLGGLLRNLVYVINQIREKKNE